MKNISDNMVFRVSQSGMDKSAKLLNLEWAVITQLDGRKDVREIATSLGLNLLEARQIFSKLWDKKYIDLVSDVNDILKVNKEALELVENELKTVCGPIAEVLCLEAQNILGISPDSFRMSLLGEYLLVLCGLLSEPNAEKRLIENVYPKTKEYLIKI